MNIVTAKPNFDIQGGSLNLTGGQLNEAGLRARYNLINEKLALDLLIYGAIKGFIFRWFLGWFSTRLEKTTIQC